MRVRRSKVFKTNSFFLLLLPLDTDRLMVILNSSLYRFSDTKTNTDVSDICSLWLCPVFREISGPFWWLCCSHQAGFVSTRHPSVVSRPARCNYSCTRPCRYGPVYIAAYPSASLPPPPTHTHFPPFPSPSHHTRILWTL